MVRSPAVRIILDNQAGNFRLWVYHRVAFMANEWGRPMDDVLLNGYLWHAQVSPATNGLLLIGDAREFDNLGLRKGNEIRFEHLFKTWQVVISAVLRCPAGEPECWLWVTYVSEGKPAERRVRHVSQSWSMVSRW
jgi:hypothetical protein